MTYTCLRIELTTRVGQLQQRFMARALKIKVVFSETLSILQAHDILILCLRSGGRPALYIMHNMMYSRH